MFTFLQVAEIHLGSPLLELERYERVLVEEVRMATRNVLKNIFTGEVIDTLLLSESNLDETKFGRATTNCSTNKCYSKKI